LGALVDGRRPGPGKPSPLTRRWEKRLWPARESARFAEREYWAGDRGRQRSVRQLRARSRTPRRGCPALRGTGPLIERVTMTNPVEAGSSTSLELSPGAGLPEMVVLRHFAVPPASAEGIPRRRGSGRVGEEPNGSHELHAAARRSAVSRGCASSPREVALGKSSGTEGCSEFESVAEIGERHLAGGREESREANQASAG